MSLYAALAKEKIELKTSDGEYILPNQRGVLAVVKFVEIKDSDYPEVTKTVILVGEILKSTAKTGGDVQTKGTRIKVVYSLAKFKFHKKRLKADICTIAGYDPTQLNEKAEEELFEAALANNSLSGIAVNFDSKLLPRDGKTPITEITLSQVTGPSKNGVPEGDHLNTSARIKERADSFKADGRSASEAPF